MGLGSGAAQLGRYVEVSKIRLGVPLSMLVFWSERNVWNAWNAKQYLSAYLSRVAHKLRFRSPEDVKAVNSACRRKVGAAARRFCPASPAC